MPVAASLVIGLTFAGIDTSAKKKSSCQLNYSKISVSVTDEKQLEQINKILEGLDDNDDVIDVFHSWDEEED